MSSRPDRGGGGGGLSRNSGRRGGSAGRYNPSYGQSSNRHGTRTSSSSDHSFNSRREYNDSGPSRFRPSSGRGQYRGPPGSPEKRSFGGDRGLSYPHYHHHSGRGVNSGARATGASEEHHLPALWHKLEQAKDEEQLGRIAQQIKNLLDQPDNKQSQSMGKQFDQGVAAIDSALTRSTSDKALHQTLSQCIGRLGWALGSNAQRFFQWVMSKFDLNSELSDSAKAVYIGGLHEALVLSSGHAHFVHFIPSVVSTVQHHLEVVESPVLLEPLIHCLVAVGKSYKRELLPCFKNMVDILVGWHIDTTQEDSLLEFISTALQSFSTFWAGDMQFTLDLLNQFLEDMQAYSTELSGQTSSGLSQEEPSAPELCLSKLIALIKVFTTVVKGVGDHFSPSKVSAITSSYVNDTIQRILSSIKAASEVMYSEELLIAGNCCFNALCKSLEIHFASYIESVLTFVLGQFEDTDTYSEEHTLSASLLVLLMVETLQTSLPSSFLQRVLAVDSPILQFRYSASQKLLACLVTLYTTVFSVRNIPLLEVAYTLLNADLEAAMKDLLRVIEERHTTIAPSEGDANGQPKKDLRSLSPYEAQGAVIFDLSILSRLSTTAKSVMGMWSPRPCLHTLVTSLLATLHPSLACEYPAVHYALLQALYQECQSGACPAKPTFTAPCSSHGHFIPGASCPITIGSSSLSLADPNATGSLSEVLLLLTKQMEHYTLSHDSCCLLMRWVDRIIELLVTDKDKTKPPLYQTQFDALAMQLLAFTFSREHTVRLETASLLKAVIQHQLISNTVVKLCVPEFLMRLTDTRGEIRAAYSTLLEVVPTCVITSASKGIDVHTPTSGRKGLEGLRSSYGTWLARNGHMTRTSQATFHGHHFKAIMGFILNGYAPSKHLLDDWLERMFHSCQHRQPQVSLSSSDNPESHPLLMSHLVGNCDAVLWHWAVYESAQYCVMARLRTPLGSPTDTFQMVEGVLCRFAQEVEYQRSGKQLRDTPSSFSGHMGAGLGPRHYTVHLRTSLLLHFIEHLEKLMYNAYEGVSPMIFPSAPKPVRMFFRINRSTCQEWLGRIRGYLVTIGNHTGMPAMAVRNGFEALMDLKHKTKSVEFWQMLVSVVKALVTMGSWEAVHGLADWCQMRTGTKPLWIQGAEAQAKGSYEVACEEYSKALGLLHSSDDEEDEGARAVRASQSVIVEFIVNELCDCYSKVRDWKEVVSWDSRVDALRKQHSEMEGAFKLHCNIEQIKALSCFETGDMTLAREFLDQQDTRRDPEVFPMWDPQQLLAASKTLLLRSVVPQSVGEGSGSDETLSAADDSEYGSRSSLRRWMKLSSAFTESPIRVRALDWPLHISPAHALQLQVTAALKAVTQVKSRHQGTTSSGLLLHSVPFKSLDPTVQDGGTWNSSLRYISYIHKHQTSNMDLSALPGHVSDILLESVRLARSQQNNKLAHVLLRRHVLELTGDSHSNDTDFSLAILNMNSSPRVSAEDKLKVMREISKLNACSGQLPQAIETLAVSINAYSSSAVDGIMKRGSAANVIAQGSPEGNELSARSFLSMFKWLHSDSRVVQSMWKSDTPVMQELDTLLHMEEEVRSEGAGLFEGDHESWDLFVLEDSKFERHEFAMGQLLHLATVYAPKLAKSWWHLAGWCYRIGRKNLEAISSSGCAELQEQEKQNLLQIIPRSVSAEELHAICGVLGQVHASDDSSDDLKVKEDTRHTQEEEVKVIRRQLLAVCPALERMPTLDGLITIWQGVRNRIFKHYQLAARAYFRFLNLSGHDPDDTQGVDDMNVTATLRLLRLLVKYAIELKVELEAGFLTTPTKPWKGIIPQLFSRLNHPDANVRQSVLDLLCRVGEDTPHYIIYPAVVGVLKRNMADRTNMPGLLGDTGSENNFDSGVGVDGMGVDMYSPPDTPISVDPVDSDQGSSEDGEGQGLTNLEKCHQMIVDSLTAANPSLVREVHTLVTELCRVTLLWEEMWLATLMQRQGELYRRLIQIESEAKRTATLNFLTHEQRQAILRKKYESTMKPLIWLLEHLQAVTSQPPETNNERIFQATYQQIIASAILTLKRPPSYSSPHSAWEPFKEFQQMLMQRSQKRMASAISLHEVSPHLAAITSSNITLPGLENIGEHPVTLESFNLDIHVLPTKTKPKKIAMIGSDGRCHTYLFKGLEDLHLDERIMQFMTIVNNMFVRAHKRQKQVYRARDYVVTPLGARSGLIQWIDSATPLFGLYKRWQQREAYANAQAKQLGPDGGQAMPVQILKPNELFYSKIIPLLKKHGMSEQTSRKDWPHEVQRRVLEELMGETPNDLLARELWAASTCATEWWHVTETYARSTAVMSMIGYIIGLGDRHLDNLLVEFATGQVIHVDYNVCFEKGKSLRVPEKVPFRMTQNIESACGFTGVEGVFRLSCEEILKILRRGRETLLTLLEAFVYDPLVDWTHTEDAAFPLSMKSPAEASGLQTRKEMEREVAEGLLVTRLAEMSPHWDHCRDNLVTVMAQVQEALGHIADVCQQLCSHQDQLISLDKQVEVLQEALHTPNHPLISMQDRLTEQVRLKTDLERIMGALRERYRETQEWQRRHKNAFDMMQGHAFQEISSKLRRPCDIGQAGYEVAAAFLHSAGQGHTVDTCKQLDDELVTQLQRHRALLNTCLEALTTYSQVTCHYPERYCEENRSHAWSMALRNVCEEDAPRTEDFHKAIVAFESSLTPSADPKLALAVNTKLRKYIQDMYAKTNKLGERMRSLNVQDLQVLEETVQENKHMLKKFCEEFGDAGAIAMSCFLIMAIAPLNRRWLFMEQTAYNASERLSDLTSREGDSFLDELCTMSGNVQQVVEALEFCMECIHQGPIKESSLLRCSIVSLREVNRVYMSMQKLLTIFQLETLPLCVNFLLKEDKHFMAKMDAILGVTLETQPDLTVREVMSKLLEELKNSALKDFSVESSVAMTLQEVKNKYKPVLVVDCPPEEELPPGLKVFKETLEAMDQMEDRCTYLFTALERIAAPVEWGHVDVFKEAEALLCSIPGSILYVELFFLRKAIAVYDFCYELNMLHEAFKVDISSDGDAPGLTPPTPPMSPILGFRYRPDHVPSDVTLSLPIRKYISSTLTTHLLGHPSHALSCITLSVVHQLGVGFDSRPMVLDDLCRMAQDHCQTNFTYPIMQQARQLYSNSDLAWREWDKGRRLTRNLEVQRETLSHFTHLTTCFQWLHEEALNQPAVGHPWVGPQRSSTLIPLKKASSDQIINSVNSVKEKMQSQHFRISQRLQWAAGANPGLNVTLDDFERAISKRSSALQAEEELCVDIINLCKAVIHLESIHNRTTIRTAYDKDIVNLLNKGAEVQAQLMHCDQHLAKVSDIVPLIELPRNEPVTMSWMSSRLEELNTVRNRITKDKKDGNHKLARFKEAILADLEKLRGYNRNYRKLMAEVWQHLTCLGRLDPPLPPGHVNPGPRACIAAQHKFSEGVRELMQMTQQLIAADLSIAKPSTVDRDAMNKYGMLRDMAGRLRELVDWLLVQLNEFVSELFSSASHFTWVAPPAQLLQDLQPKGAPTGQNPENKLYRTAHGVVRDPRTGKAIQEQNTHAVAVWRRVKAKLDGRDLDSVYRMTVTEQVDFIIQEATSLDHLCELYEGWTPWV